MTIPEIKAWKVSDKNTKICSLISGVDERAFIGNVGWILVEDWSESPRFLIMPEHTFHMYYPKLEFTELKVDEVDSQEIHAL